MRKKAIEWDAGQRGEGRGVGSGLFSKPLKMYMALVSVEGFGGNVKWPDY
jgi:hypothetical protein